MLTLDALLMTKLHSSFFRFSYFFSSSTISYLNIIALQGLRIQFVQKLCKYLKLNVTLNSQIIKSFITINIINLFQKLVNQFNLLLITVNKNIQKYEEYYSINQQNLKIYLFLKQINLLEIVFYKTFIYQNFLQ